MPGEPGSRRRAPGASRGRTCSRRRRCAARAPRAAQASVTSGVSMKPKRACTAWTFGMQLLDQRARHAVLARRALDLEVQDHDLLVADVVVLEVAQQRGRHEARVAHEEHRGAGHARRVCQQLRQLGRTARRARELGAQLRAAVAPGDEQREHHGGQRQRHPAAARDLGGVAGDEREVDEQNSPNTSDDAPQRPLPRGCARRSRRATS